MIILAQRDAADKWMAEKGRFYRWKKQKDIMTNLMLPRATRTSRVGKIITRCTKLPNSLHPEMCESLYSGWDSIWKRNRRGAHISPIILAIPATRLCARPFALGTSEIHGADPEYLSPHQLRLLQHSLYSHSKHA